MQLKNQSTIITGASQGFGLEVAKHFVKEGSHVMLCARNEKELQLAAETLRSIAPPDIQVLTKQTDVSNIEQVDELIKTTHAAFGKIDILIANAGVYGPKGSVDENDWDEWSKAIDINLKGTVLQCRAVLPHFKKQSYGKIIILSGGGATKPMPYLSAYAASKAGVIRFAETLAQEVKDFHIDVNSVAPGALNTRLLNEILQAGSDKVGKDFFEQSLKQQQNGGTPLEKGTSLCVFLASSASNGITGKLISAVWDPWQKLPDYLQELNSSDIYTLRRIMPKDRNQDW